MNDSFAEIPPHFRKLPAKGVHATDIRPGQMASRASTCSAASYWPDAR